MKKQDFLDAIDLAPTLKNRHTYLHEQKYRDLAKDLVRSDARLQTILH